MSRAGMRALKKKSKEFAELCKLGKQYDNETDPEKKEALKKEIEERCAALKGSLRDVQNTTAQDAPVAPEEAAADDQ